jgi:hypothetical protein
MDRAITRPILWNVPASFIALMYGLVALLIAAFVLCRMAVVSMRIFRQGRGSCRPAWTPPVPGDARRGRAAIGLPRSAAFARFIRCAAVSKPGNKQVCRSGLSMKMWAEPEDGLV